MTHSHHPNIPNGDPHSFEQNTIRDLIDLERDRVRGKTEIALRELQIEADERAAHRADALAFKKMVTEGFAALTAACTPILMGAIKDAGDALGLRDLATDPDGDDDDDREGGQA